MTAPAENGGTEGTPDETDDAAAQAALAAAQAQEAEGGDEGDDSGESGLDPKVRAKIDRANREAQALRAKVKELEPLAAELKKVRDGEKSDLTRAQEALAEREAEVKRLTVDNLRRDAALAAGLSGEFVEFLTGETEEEITEQAKKLAKHLKPAEPPKPKVPDLRQGNRGAAAPGAIDKNNIIRQMAGFQPQ